MQKQHFNVIVLLTGLFLGLNTMLFAEGEPSQPQSEIKGEVVQGVPVKVEIVEKALPNYTLTLKQLIEEAGKNIKKVEKEIEKKEIIEEDKHEETMAREKEFTRQREELKRKKEVQAQEQEKQRLQKQKQLELAKQKQEKTRLELERKRQEEFTLREQERKAKAEAFSRQKLELEREKMRPYQIDIALKEQERLREEEIERQLRDLGEKN